MQLDQNYNRYMPNFVDWSLNNSKTCIKERQAEAVLRVLPWGQQNAGRHRNTRLLEVLYLLIYSWVGTLIVRRLPLQMISLMYAQSYIFHISLEVEMTAWSSTRVNGKLFRHIQRIMTLRALSAERKRECVKRPFTLVSLIISTAWAAWQPD